MTGKTDRPRSRRRRVLTLILGVVVVAGLVIAVRPMLRDPGETNLVFAPGLLALACLVLAVAYVVFAIHWKIVLGLFGARIGLQAAFEMCMLAMLGKYVPGKIWSFVVKVERVQSMGHPLRIGVVATAVEQVIFLGTGLAIASFSVPSILGLDVSPLVLVAIVFAVAIAATSPGVFGPVVSAMLRMLGHREALEVPSRRRLALPILVMTSMWILIAAAFCLFLRGLGADPAEAGSQTAIGGAFVLAWVAGYAAFLIPGGLGVREGVLLVGLSGVAAPGAVVAMVGLARLWQAGVEVVLVPVSLLSRLGGRGRSGRETP